MEELDNGENVTQEESDKWTAGHHFNHMENGSDRADVKESVVEQTKAKKIVEVVVVDESETERPAPTAVAALIDAVSAVNQLNLGLCGDFVVGERVEIRGLPA